MLVANIVRITATCKTSVPVRMISNSKPSRGVNKLVAMGTFNDLKIPVSVLGNSFHMRKSIINVFPTRSFSTSDDRVTFTDKILQRKNDILFYLIGCPLALAIGYWIGSSISDDSDSGCDGLNATKKNKKLRIEELDLALKHLGEKQIVNEKPSDGPLQLDRDPNNHGG